MAVGLRICVFRPWVPSDARTARVNPLVGSSQAIAAARSPTRTHTLRIVISPSRWIGDVRAAHRGERRRLWPIADLPAADPFCRRAAQAALSVEASSATPRVAWGWLARDDQA